MKRRSVAGAGGSVRGSEHGFNGLDSGDGLLRKREPEGDSAEQLAIDINRAAAHALYHAGFGERAAAESGENNALLWTEIIEHAEDFDLELFDLLAVKDGAAYTVHAGADIFEWEEALSGAGLIQKK